MEGSTVGLGKKGAGNILGAGGGIKKTLCLRIVHYKLKRRHTRKVFQSLFFFFFFTWRGYRNQTQGWFACPSQRKDS